MALPTITTLSTMDFAYYGQPFVAGPAKSSIDLEAMDFAYYGQPFVTNESGGATESTVSLSEVANVLDQLLLEITLYLDERVNVLDSARATDDTFGDPVNILDTLTTEVIVYLNEYVRVLDAFSNDEDLDLYGTVVVSVLESIEKFGTTTSQIQEELSGQYTTDVSILEDNLVAVTSASSASNPLQPTLIINGTTIYSFPATLPAEGLANAQAFINFLCDAISGATLDDVFSWSLNIDGGMGNWKTVTVDDIADYGTEITIFGLTGTITKKGFDRSNSSDGYINGGVLGKRDLNKPLYFLIYPNLNLAPNILTQNQTLPAGYQYTTHKAAAQAIANLAGVSVSWNIPDLPLVDFQAQGSMSALESLNSIAEEVGAKLRWNGGTAYTIAYPDHILGTWTVPDCSLISAMSQECNLDLKTGLYSPGIYLLPELAPPAELVSTLKVKVKEAEEPQQSGGVNVSQVEEIHSTTKMLTSEDPIESIDLPFDFDSVYIQIVTATDAQGTFVTFDPDEWFLLQTGFAGRYINNVDVGGILKPRVKLDWTLFPQTNTDLVNGHFYLKLGVRRKTLNGAFDDAAKEAVDQQKNTLGRTLSRYKFIPVCVGNISAAFFGSIPLPGMWASATIGDKTVQGIIESVSFSSPGIINVSVVQYRRLDLYNQLGELDNSAWL